VSASIPLPPIHREHLPSGLSVVVAERPGVPLVAVRVVLRGGASLDPAARFGLAHLVAATARRGTRRRSGPELDDAVESLGAELGGGVDEDATYLGLTAPAESLGRCLDVLAEVIAEPSFPTREVDRLRRREVASLSHDLDEPGVVADRAMLTAAFGRHPYGHAPEGRARHLAAVKRADIAAFHARYWRPGLGLIVVVGPLPAGEVLAQIRRRFGGWRAAATHANSVAPPPRLGRSVVVVDKPELTQTQVRIVSPGFARASPDYFPGVVASAVLGGGFTSRLMEAIRVNRGLSYGVRSRFSPSRAGGLFFVSTFTKVETTAEIVDVASDEIAKFREDGPTDEELERTKSYLCGLFPLSLETHDQLAEKLTDLELHGLPETEITAFREHVRAVGPDACRDVARRYFPGDSSGIVVAVGPAREIAAPLAKFGEVTVVPARKVI
jgi:zinc protease